jgi:dUTP pyrophosphatase
MVEIKIKKLVSEAIIPHYVHDGDAGMDVYSIENCILEIGDIKLVKTGIAFEVPKGYEIQVRPKSGLALKNGITLTNSPGTIDSGYRGELGVIMQNCGKAAYEIKKGEKIAQIVLAKYELAEIKEATDLTESTRGAGGFGSTGLKQHS